MRRHSISLGAKTTAGGTVITASSSSMFNGQKFALAGDKVACPACKSIGVIVCVPPRIDLNYDGKEIALENDLCACLCQPRPLLIPIQSFHYMEGHSSGGISSLLSSGLQKSGTQSYENHFIIKDKQTQQPTDGFVYGIKNSSGEYHDHVCHDGCTTGIYMNSQENTDLLYAVQTQIGME